MTNRMLLAPALALCGALATGCAHKAATQPEEVTAKAAPAPAPAPKQVEITTEPARVDGREAVEAALKNVTVRFDFDRDVLRDDAQAALQRLAPVLRKHPEVRIRIAGHCDERGTEEYNLLLGQRRAEAARRYLADLGVGDRQLDTVSYGDQQPLSEAHTEDAWALNRRDELTPHGK